MLLISETTNMLYEAWWNYHRYYHGRFVSAPVIDFFINLDLVVI